LKLRLVVNRFMNAIGRRVRRVMVVLKNSYRRSFWTNFCFFFIVGYARAGISVEVCKMQNRRAQ
jgi:hypothetical protein